MGITHARDVVVVEGWQEVGVPRGDVDARLLQRRQSAFRSPAAVSSDSSASAASSSTIAPSPVLASMCRMQGLPALVAPSGIIASPAIRIAS